MLYRQYMFTYSNNGSLCIRVTNPIASNSEIIKLPINILPHLSTEINICPNVYKRKWIVVLMSNVKMRLLIIAGCLCHFVIFSAASSTAPADWTASEIERTKARLWTIFKNPIKFVKWLKTPNPTKDCGHDCWDGCDDFR